MSRLKFKVGDNVVATKYKTPAGFHCNSRVPIHVRCQECHFFNGGAVKITFANGGGYRTNVADFVEVCPNVNQRTTFLGIDLQLAAPSYSWKKL